MTIGTNASNIMVIGGYQDKKFLYKAWTFNTKTKEISQKEEMNQNREAFGITFDSLEEEVYVIGGQGNKF